MSNGNNEAGGGERLLSLRDVLGTLERRKWTVVGGTLVTLGIALLWLAQARPTYRAQATLLLEDPGATSGFIGQLASLGSAPAAESEMAVLRSREIARRTAAAPPGFSLLEREALEHPTALGLTTQVDDTLFAPLAASLGSARDAQQTQVWASVDERAPDAPTAVELEFLDGGSLRVSAAGLLPGGPEDLIVSDPSSGSIAYQGLRFRLAWEGDPTGHHLRLRTLPLEVAVDQIIARTTVAESERNSGVILISYDDSDPRRAARVVNALCDNYREYSVGRARRGASRAIDFIDEQLALQLEELEQAEMQLVQLQSEHPEAIDVDASAGALIEQMTNLETARVESQLAMAGLEDALGLLGQGEAEGLSQLRVQLDDPVSLGYLEAITRLTAESETQARSDTGAFKLLQQTKLAELRTRQEQLRLIEENLGVVSEGLAQGDESVLARLESSPNSDPITVGYLTELARLRSEQALLATTLTDDHPQLTELSDSIASLLGLISGQVTSLLHSAQADSADNAELIGVYEETLARHADEERGRLTLAANRIAGRLGEHLSSRLGGYSRLIAEIEEQINTLQGRLAALPESQWNQADTMRRLRTHEAVAELLLRSRQEAGITEASTVPAAEVLDRALPPRQLFFPRPLPTLLFAGVIGLAMGALLAFVRDRLAGHIASEAEVESVTGLPVLGSIPNFRRGPARVRGAGSRFIALVDDPDGVTADAYRSVRASLRFATQGEGDLCVLGVTSAVASEGKTSTNLNLALACAAAGERVLLVDCDLRRPSVHRYLDLEQSPGLGEALAQAGGPGWRESIRRIANFDLDVLPAGKTKTSSGDLLADEERFSAFLGEIRSCYDLIILDLPPVLATSDALAVAGKLDAVVLLYKSEGAPAGALRLATGKLRRTGANVVGAVLCALRPTRYGDSGYSSYYGYGYGQPQGQRRARRVEAFSEAA